MSVPAHITECENGLGCLVPLGTVMGVSWGNWYAMGLGSGCALRMEHMGKKMVGHTLSCYAISAGS